MDTKHTPQVIVVTGGSGKVGRATIPHLQQLGYVVRNADRNPLSPSFGVPTIAADLTDLGQVYGVLEGADAVVHLAAIPTPTGHPPEVVFQTNVQSTFNVLQAAVVLGIKKIILVSSLSLMGLSFCFRPVDLHYLPLDESHPPLAQDSYGISKIVGEVMADGFARRDPELTLVSLRFTMVMSEADYSPVVARWRQDPAAGASVLWTYIDVRDTARSIGQALAHALSGHRAYYVNAPQTLLPNPTIDLLQQNYPGVVIHPEKLAGNAAPIDCTAIRDALAFEPIHLWQPDPIQGQV